MPQEVTIASDNERDGIPVDQIRSGRLYVVTASQADYWPPVGEVVMYVPGWFLIGIRDGTYENIDYLQSAQVRVRRLLPSESIIITAE